MQIGLSLVAWVTVGVFWLFTTRNYHPTWSRAYIVTASLIVAYATAAYINHLVLIPRFWRRPGVYALLLVLTMITLTATALGVILWAFFEKFGLRFDLAVVYHNYLIDLFGMVVHVSGAAVVVWVYRRVSKSSGSTG